MASVPRVGGQRQAVGTRADDRNIVVGGVHPGLHGVQRIEPAVIAGVLPGKALHGLNDRQRGKLRQDVPAGEKLRALFILGEDRLAEGMHDQHPLARERGAPRAGVVVGLQRTQLGKAGGIAAAYDLPLGTHIPEREQLGALGGADIEFAEPLQRGVIRRENARKVADVGAGAVGKRAAAVVQVVGGGAHLGRAAAAEQEGLAAFQQITRKVIADPGRQDRHAAVFHFKAQAAVKVGGLLHQQVIVIHGRLPFWAAGSAPARRCSATENARSHGSGRHGPWRHRPCSARRPSRPLCCRADR